MSKHRIILYFSLFTLHFSPFTSFSLHAQTKVAAFQPGQKADGVTYCLPRTVIRTQLQAIKTVYTPGQFARYAERYLSMQNVSTQAETRYQIQKATLTTAGVPDTTKIYTVKLKDKTLAPIMQLTETGIVQAINSSENYTKDPQQTDSPIATHHQLNPRQYFTEEILAATSSARMAELVAQEIYDIRESKNEIMRGQVETMPKDGASLKIVLDQLNQQEEALTQCFVGHVDTTYLTHTYEFDPQGDADQALLFRFSRKLGFVDVDDFAGEPYYLSVKDQHTAPQRDEKEAGKLKIEGVVYNIPSTAQVTLSDGKRNIVTQKMPIAQFGTIEQLAPALFNKNTTTQVFFDTATGALLQLKQ